MRAVAWLSFILTAGQLSSAGAKTPFTFKIGNYRADISQNVDTRVERFTLKFRNKNIFQMEETGTHHFLGSKFSDTPKLKALPLGRDLTGNHIPNLIVSTWTGGAHCCNFVRVFELGNQLKVLVTVEANSSSVNFLDLDGDGFPEIEFWDGAIDYQFASFAFSPGGRTVLKFKNGHYVVAPELMRTLKPTRRYLAKKELELARSLANAEGEELPYDFLKTMMDLSYSGHIKVALEVAARVWPRRRDEFEKFKNEFKSSLIESQYYRSAFPNVLFE